MNDISNLKLTLTNISGFKDMEVIYITDHGKRLMKKTNLKLDNYGRGLLVSIVSKAISNDRDLTPDDIEKLKEIKKQLQDS
jgi:hypothetical protein